MGSTMESASNWKNEIAGLLKVGISTVESVVDDRWHRMKRHMGWDGTARIQPYIGMANQHKLWLSGRVLSNPVPTPPAKDDSWWDNILASWQRWESDEVPDVSVQLSYGDQTHLATSDDEGYFYFEVDLIQPLRREPWQQVELRIVGDDRENVSRESVTAMVRSVKQPTSYGIISDMDDTVIHTGVTGLLTAAKMTFLHNAQTRTPLKAVGELYQAFVSGPTDQHENNPVFYVSSSPWNLFDLLVEFLKHNKIPLGPLLLRDFGVDRSRFIAGGHGHKLEKIQLLLRTFPDLPFILVGDSGQQDAELYARAVQDHPGRIRAAFIRDVDPGIASDRDQLVDDQLSEIWQDGVLLRRVQDSVEIAEAARDMGLIDEAHLPDIRAAVIAEEIET